MVIERIVDNSQDRSRQDCSRPGGSQGEMPGSEIRYRRMPESPGEKGAWVRRRLCLPSGVSEAIAGSWARSRRR